MVLGGCELALHRRERRIDLGAERRYGCDTRDGDERDNESVFNERCAVFIDEDAFQIGEHGISSWEMKWCKGATFSASHRVRTT